MVAVQGKALPPQEGNPCARSQRHDNARLSVRNLELLTQQLLFHKKHNQRLCQIKKTKNHFDTCTPVARGSLRGGAHRPLNGGRGGQNPHIPALHQKFKHFTVT
jgi:hypothetical protein